MNSNSLDAVYSRLMKIDLYLLFKKAVVRCVINISKLYRTTALEVITFFCADDKTSHRINPGGVVEHSAQK